MKSSNQHQICIVDDDSAVRDSLRLLLELHGFHVDPFESAAAFLNSGKTGYDCMVVDFHMPGMSGLDLIEMLRANGDITPVVMITGRADPSVVHARVRQAQVLTMLIKPFAHEQLIEWIERAVGVTSTN